MPKSGVETSPRGEAYLLESRPEHDDLRHVVRSLLERLGDHGTVRIAAESERGFSSDLWTRLNQDLDVSSMLVPEDLGGAGFGVRDVAVLLEETGASLLPEPVLFSSVLAARALAYADDPERVAHLLPGLMTGAVVGTVCLVPSPVEVAGGRANGLLPRVVIGGEADMLVFSTPSGIFLVEREAPGVRVRELEVLDLTRRQAEVQFVDAPVAALVLAPRAAQTWSRLTRLATIGAAAEHLGIMRHQLEGTVDYVCQRTQFGRQVGSFQAVKHRLADVLVDLERARSAVAYAAALFDADPDSALAAEVAGAVTTCAVMDAAHEAIQLHGGIGFTWEHEAHYYLRRVLGDEGIFGSARSHRTRIAELAGL